jgi:hypothetical protein
MRKLIFSAVFCLGLVVAAVQSNAQTETVVYSFSGSDGNSPSTALIQANDLNFYGGTASGGADYYGVVYQVNSTGTSFQDLYTFTNGSDGTSPSTQLLQGSDGNFYGSTPTTVYQVTPDGVLTTLASPGGDPTSVIQASDGNFYYAVAYGSGIYQINAATLVVTQIGTAPGYGLSAMVQASDGNFYGTEQGGGSTGGPSIFACTLAGVVTTFYSFPSGLSPASGLIEGVDGELYGVASDTTGTTTGQIYKIDLSGNYTTVVTIPLSDNINPPGQLTIASDGNFYALASGTSSGSSLIEITPSGTLTFPLTISDLGGLNSPLIQGNDGSLYGAAANGGTNSNGAVYNIALSPALAAPVTLTLGAASIPQGSNTTLNWSVVGAYSDSAGYCFATSNDPEWSGVQATSGGVTLTPASAGTFTYTLTCGGTISNSTTLTVTSAGPVNTTTGLTASPNPVTLGGLETLTATVTPASGTNVPSGTVSFNASGIALGTATLNGSGVAALSLNASGVPAGTYAVTATYAGSTSFSGSTSPVVNVTVNKIASTVAVTATPATVSEGGSVALSATVSPASGSITPTGTVTFTAAGMSLGTHTLSGGTAGFTSPVEGIPPGSYSVVVSYSGDGTYLASSGHTTVVVKAAATTTGLTVDPNPVTQGSSATLTATVARTSGTGIPTGTVTFSAAGTVVGKATLSGGVASLTASTSSIPKGTYPVKATYNGDANDDGSASPVVSVKVE